MKFDFTTPPPGVGGPTLRLPVVALLVGWLVGSMATLGGGAVLGSALGASGPDISAGLLGASISVGVMGLGLLAAGAGRERPATEMPTVWPVPRSCCKPISRHFQETMRSARTSRRTFGETAP